jgi:hypothetical protein
LLNSGRVELPRHQRLLAQLRGLERRVARGGRESVDHIPGAFDDLANAACGAICLAANAKVKKFFEPFVMTVRVGRTSFPVGPQSGDLSDPFYEAPGDNWRKI